MKIFYAAKALIYSSKKLLRNKVLLGKRTITGGYEPLGGKLESHETPEEALEREIIQPLQNEFKELLLKDL